MTMFKAYLKSLEVS